MEKIKKNDWLVEVIREARQKGIGVSIDGISYSTDKEEELSMVLESDNDYMSDYMGDAGGKIVHIYYDKIESGD